MSIATLSAKELRKAADLKEQIAKLETDLNHILGSPATTVAEPTKHVKKKGGMSAAGRAAVAAAQRARWAKINAGKTKLAAKFKKARKKMSAVGRARIVAAQKSRWAKIEKGPGHTGPKKQIIS